MASNGGALTFAERALCLRVATGELADVTGGDEAEVDGPARERSRTVRASWLRRLIMGEISGVFVHWRGLRLCGAKIEGPLDLEAATVDYPMTFTRCSFDEPFRLVDASVRRIKLSGCDVAALEAAGAHLRGDLVLGQGTVVRGAVSLIGAEIEGSLDCDGARLANVPRSLSGDGLQVRGDVRLGVRETSSAPAFTAVGTVSLVRAQIGGDLDCDGGEFGGNPSVNLSRARVAGGAFMGVTETGSGVCRFEAAGLVTADWVQVGGSVNCDGGYFHDLDLDYARVKGSVYLGADDRSGVQIFRARGPVSLQSSVIDGAVDCRGGQFLAADDMCLDLTGTSAETVKLGAISIGGTPCELAAAGLVSLARVEVKGDVVCSGGQFNGAPIAVNAQDATIGGAAHLGVVVWGRHTSTFHAKGEVNLRGAKIRGDLICRGGQFASRACALRADGAGISGTVYLSTIDAAGQATAFRARGEVRLMNATIGSDLRCGGGRFEAPDVSINADGVSVGREVYLGVIALAGRGHPFTALGEIRFVDARIGNDFDCGGARMEGPTDRTALRLDGANVEGQALIRTTEAAGQPCRLLARGSVSLIQTRIRGDLDCDGAEFEGSHESSSLVMYDANVGGTVFLGATEVAGAVVEFRATSQVRMDRAMIGRNLNCSGGHFSGPDEWSLIADNITVAGKMYLGVYESAPSYRFRAKGGVSLVQVSLGGELDCRGGAFQGKKCSLQMDGASVGRTIRLGVIATDGGVHRFTADGEVRLVAMTAGREIDCRGGEFRGSPLALHGDRVKVHGTLWIGETKAAGASFRFVAAGEVRLAAAAISGDLVCDGAEFRSQQLALSAEGITVTGGFYLRTYGRPASLNLRAAHIGQINDHRDSWPPPGALDIEWMTYDGFTGTAPRTVRDRLAWLALQNGIPAQPYVHLADHYGRLGDEKAARRVHMAREWRRLRHSDLGLAGKLANVVMGSTIGYGYRPGRAVFLLVLLYVLGALLVYQPARDVMVAAKTPSSSGVVMASDRCPSNYPCYSPWAYSFDVLVPVVHLGQSDAWTPTGRRGTEVRYYGYAATVLGWALATMAVAGFTGLVRKS